jgi:hypothetical protein
LVGDLSRPGTREAEAGPNEIDPGAFAIENLAHFRAN